MVLHRTTRGFVQLLFMQHNKLLDIRFYSFYSFIDVLFYVPFSCLYLCSSGPHSYIVVISISSKRVGTHYYSPQNFQWTCCLYIKECYTRVLKGHIQLSVAVWPRGVNGSALDSFARMHLWSVGLDYKHGTGHGVGSFLNVHEGKSLRFQVTNLTHS